VERKWPFALWYPMRVKEVIRYDAPEQLSAAEFDLTNRVITHPTFELAVNQQVTGRTLRLEWELKTNSDRVMPSQVESYRRVSTEAWRQLAYRVNVPPPGEGISVPSLTVPSITVPELEEPSPVGAWSMVGLLVAGMLASVFVVRSGNAKKKKAAQPKQRTDPGELASNPARVASLEAAVSLFTSLGCPNGHGWGVVDESDTVRLGEDQVIVLSRRCGGCDAKEVRYVKLG
jgi:hypothetical protein